MAGYVLGDSSHHGAVKNGPENSIKEESEDYLARWYFSRKEIEENSPSRRDGIDLKKEAYFRKSYCTYLQDLGMRLKVPQVTIATAIVFCHRFFLRQSHTKNDRRTIATVCMFLAGKVEETPRPLKDVILVSYEIIHKKDPSAVQRIKQKEVYEQQKELILLGERLVLATLGFDLNMYHPYKPLVEAIKKFKVAQNALAQVAWNFVNDGLRTSLCLQFKPHHIAAGAIFLAAKFLKVKLPSDGEKVWWQEFDVTPRQLEDVSNQMLELYEQNRLAQPSHGNNEADGSSCAGPNHPTGVTSTVSESSISLNARQGTHPTQQTRPIVAQQSNADGDRIGSRSACSHSNDHGSVDSKSGVWDHNMDGDGKDNSNHEAELVSRRWELAADGFSSSKLLNEEGLSDDKDKCMETITKIDKDKVKAALEKTRRLRNDTNKKNEIVDDDDLIERELENGIELGVDDKRHGWPKPLHPLQTSMKPKHFKSENPNVDNRIREEFAEEGELSSLDDHDHHSLKLQSNNGKVSAAKRKPNEKIWSDLSDRDHKRVRKS
ncbi:cyclin-T1-3-like [Phalaenopsis equestris]|uniref:cyclin-T1-3-like n=1 Tax=Phalaenopsis equestris TaxID=78828 RepID=UPI0009E56B42|nr:cyclin-T1-3-like [Phalaenopsis equestris]XP_020580854.1 cyclin-T1-3-like [Phalaenopsis equestris]